jgi:transposase-like protein
MNRRRHSRDRWHAWVREQRESGLNISSFCRDKGISQNSFYVWRRKLSVSLANDCRAKQFVSLAVVTGSEIKIELPCGARILLPPDESAIKRVLSILLELGIGQ